MAMPAMANETIEDVYDRLMAARRGDPIEDTLARILASWMTGSGAMPVWLGMGESAFRSMIGHHFPALDAAELTGASERVDPQRTVELDDLRKLLLDNRSGCSPSEVWMAEIVIVGCLGSDHLWQDLGLWKRADLSRLMMENFAPMAMRNVKDMKWKKFLYKQMCEGEGIFVCRSPSCEVCADYDNCFGSEE
jgi:nitrogen fixation protein NifQ